jgi:hypothetical protein
VFQGQGDQAGERMSKVRMTSWAGAEGQGRPGLHGTGSSGLGYQQTIGSQGWVTNRPLAAKVFQLGLLLPPGLLPGLGQGRKEGMLSCRKRAGPVNSRAQAGSHL